MPLTQNQKDFAQFLANHWDHPSWPFPHQYAVTNHRSWNTWRAIAPGLGLHSAYWECRSLTEACTRYSWSTNTRSRSYSAISIDLQKAINKNDDADAAMACNELFVWGGVANLPRPREWVNSNSSQNTLVGKIKDAVALLQPGVTTGLNRFDGNDLLMDSALTKIYSAADPNKRIMIYDGRVGAALCLLVKRCLIAGGLVDSVPDDLGFMWGAPKDAPRDKRNPSDKSYRFKELPNRHAGNPADFKRAQLTRLTGEILEETLRILNIHHTKSGAHRTINVFDLERALFMIGYDIR